MNKKKILILTGWYPEADKPYAGIFIKKQARALSSVYDITLVHLKIDYQRFAPFFSYRFNALEGEGFPAYRLTVARSFPVYNQFNFFAAAVFQLYRRFNREAFDMIHCHVSYPAGVAGMYVSKWLNVPYAITEHTGGFVGLFRSKAHKILVLKALNRADGVATVSQASREIMSAYIRKEIQIISNMIDISEFDMASNSASGIHIGFMGGLNTDVKGLDILLKAFARIEGSNIRLHIAGGGTLTETYKKLAEELQISDRCLFYGTLAPEQTAAFYNRLDLFVLSSRRESFGVVLLEAMASGLPVVATRCGGPEEIVTPETGLLVPAEQVEALAAGIRQMIRNYKTYDRGQIRELVDRRFGVTAFLNRMQPFYSRIMGNYGSH